MDINRALSEARVSTTPAMIEPENQRAIAEVQAAIFLAKKFPRDVQQAVDRIMIACQRPALAEAAVYTYAKGGTDITGPSIRLAEAIAQSWGNLQFGIKELDQRNGESTIEAYAWDTETNVRQNKVFQVRHLRFTRKGSYALEDPREIYELTANQGARRLRACILGIIPGDIVESAVEECERTMKAKADTSPEGINKLLDAFDGIGVKKIQIEGRIQRRIDSITPGQMASMRKIFNSLRDNMSTISDWFLPILEEEAARDTAGEKGKETPKKGNKAALDALKPKVQPEPKKPQEFAQQESGPSDGEAQKIREREEIEAAKKRAEGERANPVEATKKAIEERKIRESREKDKAKAPGSAPTNGPPEMDEVPFPDYPHESVNQNTGEVFQTAPPTPSGRHNGEFVVCAKNKGDEMTRGYCRTVCVHYKNPMDCPDYMSDSI